MIEQTLQFRFNDAASRRALFDRYLVETAAQCSARRKRTCIRASSGGAGALPAAWSGADPRRDDHGIPPAPERRQALPRVASGTVHLRQGHGEWLLGVLRRRRRDIMELGAIEPRARAHVLAVDHARWGNGPAWARSSRSSSSSASPSSSTLVLRQQRLDLINGAARESGVEASLSAAGVPCCCITPTWTALGTRCSGCARRPAGDGAPRRADAMDRRQLLVWPGGAERTGRALRATSRYTERRPTKGWRRSWGGRRSSPRPPEF